MLTNNILRLDSPSERREYLSSILILWGALFIECVGVSFIAWIIGDYHQSSELELKIIIGISHVLMYIPWLLRVSNSFKRIEDSYKSKPSQWLYLPLLCVPIIGEVIIPIILICFLSVVIKS